MTHHVPIPAAERQRRHRLRQRQGVRYMGGDVPADLVRALGNRLDLDSYHDRATERGLAVCVNSIVVSDLENYCETAENVLIDEFSQVLSHIAGDAVKNKERVYAQLKRMIINAKCLILSDADLGDREIAWLEHCRPDQTFRIYEIKPDNSSLTATYQQGKEAAAVAMGAILNDLDAGKRLIVATDSKKKAIKLAELIAHERPRMRCLCIYRETAGGVEQQAFIKDSNGQCTKYEIVIHSPIISSGVSIEVKHFDRGYGLFYGKIVPSEAIQMMRRARPLKHWHLAFDLNPPRATEKPTLLTAGRRIAREDFNIDDEASEFELFQDGVDGWRARGCNNFARNTLYLLEASGFGLTPQFN